MRVYLSGPMTGYPLDNRPAFDRAASELRGLGFDVVNPSELDNGVNTADWSHADYLRRDIPFVTTCQAIFLLPGWEASKGARLELMVAASLGMPAYTMPNLEPLPDEQYPEIRLQGDPEFESVGLPVLLR